MNNSPLGSKENPFTNGQADGGIKYKYCKCRRCGRVEKCTPSTDFYVIPDDPDDGFLFCESCLWAENKARKRI